MNPCCFRPWRLLTAALVLAMAPAAAADANQAATAPANNFRQFLEAGKFSLYLRYRFEHVDDGQNAPAPFPVEDAYAHTLRTALGYNTGLFHHFGLTFQLEDVRTLGREKYNNGGANRISNRALVVDPEGLEIQQGNIRFEGVPKTVLRLGRQEIEHRQAPLHRYFGNILWRQNWQSFDAFRATTTWVPETILDYAFVWNTNRIFGEDNPIPDRSDFRMDSHLLNARYTRFDFGNFEPYIYLLDFSHDMSERFSTQTYGLRFDGTYAFNPMAKILYTGEYAYQGDYDQNPSNISVAYGLGELGFSYTFGRIVDSIMIKGSYELLEGDGGVRSFQTPLGTNHAFQGWADRFLITPGDGIENIFITARIVILGASFMAVYHDLNSDRGSYDYGTEWDLLLEKTFKKHFTIGIKYSDYDADRNSLNVSRNSASGQAFDLSRFWAWVQVAY